MVHSVAFFPWISLRERIEVGPVRLLPFVKGSLPGDLPGATQKDLEEVLNAYAVRPSERVCDAVLLEYGEWFTGMPSESVVEHLFRARRLIAFSALTQRRFFQGWAGYTNYDSYHLIVQRFLPGQADTFSYNTRRRDEVRDECSSKVCLRSAYERRLSALKTPVPAENSCPLQEASLVGAWVRRSGSGLFEEMAFGMDSYKS